ncbi:MAG: cobalamin-dependent protein, partial [Deltaproteobacteria bacterium]|nr:cobalamin-dependent protein [Deltaproteobacteria bacterium]
MGKKEIIFNSESDYPGFDIFVLNLSLKPARLSNQEYFSDFLKQFNQTPLMVCMTATSAHLDEAEEIARTARQIVPAALRIIGGPHVSVAAAEFLSTSEFQAACNGEGVETLSEIALRVSIVGKLDFSTIEGITYKHDNGKVYSNPLRVPLLGLDEYPFPSDSLEFFRGPAENPAENQTQLIYILSGYGCPHDCIFCAQRSIHGRKIRERSAENIVEEISCLYAQGFRKFAFVQETFVNRKKRIESFCRLIEDSGMQIEWTA